MNALLLFAIAFGISIVVIPLAARLALRVGLVDLPDARKVHAQPVPRVGGWGIVLGSLTPLLLVFGADPLVQSFVAGSVVLFLFGIWDDARNINHWIKFAGQALAAGIVVYHGDLYVARVPFLEVTLPPAVGQPFTLVALIGVINALNHSDGLDGLAGGESMLSLIAYAVLGYRADSALMFGIAMATMGGVMGFLRYNGFPARVFMGDCGSQALGFTLGVLAVYHTQRANVAVSAVLPLLVIGMPIADIVAVLYQRIRGGMHWFRASRNHVHHRLLQLGFEHYESVVIIYAIQALLVIGGFVLRFQADLLLAVLYLGVVGGLFTALTMAEHRGWRVSRGATTELPVLRALWTLRHNARWRNVPALVVGVVTPAIIVIGALWTARVPRDVGYVAGVLAVIGAIGAVARRGSPAIGIMITRVIAYMATVFSAYLCIQFPGELQGPVRWAALAIMALLALAIAVHIRYATEQPFGTNPTDYLIILGVIALALFGRGDADSHRMVELVIYAIVLMYGCEVIVERGRQRGILLWAAAVALLVMFVRGAGWL
jgi:UDP-GlcNAc:undecaprenyl-phosphate GlcNAc-1-phosphate transferase